MFWRHKKRPPIETLDHFALAEILREFEDNYAEHAGTRLTTAEFYDLYIAGDADDITDAMRWASYYELMRAQAKQSLVGRPRRGSVIAA